MKTRRVIALVLCLLMVLGMSTMALADGETALVNGEAGAFEYKDTPQTQNKVLKLNKELVTYNKDNRPINAPTISYKYTIGAATIANGTTVTDSGDKHESGESVTAPVYAGVMTSSAPSIVYSADDTAVSWTCSEMVSANNQGVACVKYFLVDFSDVVFTHPGIFRYEITESLANTSDTYAASGVTESTGIDAPHKRYVDVYVRAAEGFTNGSTSDEWDIYGFTCLYDNDSVEDSSKKKTTGFVSDSDNDVTADSYYTFNVKITKQVENDAYGAANIEFPFTITFTNSAITKNVDISINSTATESWDPLASGLSGDGISGITKLKDDEYIQYIGIPCGTSVAVYETNKATGTTYQVASVVTPDSDTDNPLSKSDSSVAYDETSSKVIIPTTANKAETNEYSLVVTNTLLNISPTGLMFRYGPYFLMLIGGIALIALGIKFARRSKTETEEA